MTSDMTPAARTFLSELRRTLLHLHKVLLDRERVSYERQHGRASSAQLLEVIVHHPQFAWLHPLSELIVRIDEMLDGHLPYIEAEVEAFRAQAAALLTADGQTERGRRYGEALQEHPDAVVAHAQVAELLRR